jgi:hypothetical protein
METAGEASRSSSRNPQLFLLSLGFGHKPCQENPRLEAEIYLKGNCSDHVQNPWLQAGFSLKKEGCLLIRNIKKKGHTEK